jgi:hypothetical protein
MLHKPDRRGSSSLPTAFILLAVASVAAYFAFFRPRPETAAKPAAVAAAPSPAPPVEAPRPEPPGEEKPAPKPPPKVELPPPVPVAYVPPVRTPLHEIEELCAAGQWREARAKLAPLFAAPCSDFERTELARRGMEISRQMLQDKPDEREVELYEILQGDTLEGIARKFKGLNGVKGALMYANNYRENAILRAGRKVRIPKGVWSVLVDKSLFKMWVCYEGAPFKGYTITTGAPHKETPVAKFVVGTRNPKPAWWPPADMKVTGKVPVPYGDPQNPLGEWWIALDHDLHHGIGIHGTNDPASIGTKASNGCVRMLNDEVCEVAALAYKGMVVTVVE